MQGADDVVDHGEEEPGQVEAGGEHEDAVAPARVQQRGVEIAEVPPPLLGDVLVGDACAAALLHHPLPLVHLALLIVCRQLVLEKAVLPPIKVSTKFCGNLLSIDECFQVKRPFDSFSAILREFQIMRREFCVFCVEPLQPTQGSWLVPLEPPKSPKRGPF